MAEETGQAQWSEEPGHLAGQCSEVWCLSSGERGACGGWQVGRAREA